MVKTDRAGPCMTESRCLIQGHEELTINIPCHTPNRTVFLKSLETFGKTQLQILQKQPMRCSGKSAAAQWDLFRLRLCYFQSHETKDIPRQTPPFYMEMGTSAGTLSVSVASWLI